MNVKTNVGKIFFKLLDKYFPKTNRFHKIFNRNNVKLSYSCVKNIGSIMSSHNKLKLSQTNIDPSCNCRMKQDCPVENKCLSNNIIYKAEVTNNLNQEEKFYIGLTANSFKDRLNKHKTSFKHRRYENQTELSKYIWKLKDENKVPTIKWSILKKTGGSVSKRYCKLCLMEKLFIIKSIDNVNILNRRKKLISKCRHINKNILHYYKSDSYD